MELLNTFLKFLSENSTFIFLLFVVWLFRKPLTGLLNRATSLCINSGDTELKVDTSTDFETGGVKVEPEGENNQNNTSDNNDSHWLFDCSIALHEGRTQDAEKILRKYELEEDDEALRVGAKALFLSMQFSADGDPSCLVKLQKMADSQVNEDIKFSVLEKLARCFKGTSQLTKKVEFWRHNIALFTESLIVTKCVIKLSEALREANRLQQAKELLLDRLKTVKNDGDKSLVYQELGAVEKACNHLPQSALCLDKAVEYDISNKDKLFNAAFSADDNNLTDISIINYDCLLQLDARNSAAINNIGVIYNKLGLKHLAVQSYKHAGNLDSGLAIANHGYQLLNAGFISEAEELANTAVKQGITHTNLYKLLSVINEQEKDERNKRDDFLKSSLVRQQLIRQYTNGFYEGYASSFKGQWRHESDTLVKVTEDASKIELSWIEKTVSITRGTTYKIKITGEVTNSTFKGTYIKSPTTETKSLLTSALAIPMDKNIPCFGFLSKDGQIMNIFSEKKDDSLSLKLFRVDVS